MAWVPQQRSPSPLSGSVEDTSVGQIQILAWMTGGSGTPEVALLPQIPTTWLVSHQENVGPHGHPLCPGEPVDTNSRNKLIF